MKQPPPRHQVIREAQDTKIRAEAEMTARQHDQHVKETPLMEMQERKVDLREVFAKGGRVSEVRKKKED